MIKPETFFLPNTHTHTHTSLRGTMQLVVAPDVAPLVIKFRTKQTSTANIRSVKLFPSTILNLSYKATHLSWSMELVDLSLEGPSIVGSMMTRA